jgi:hypothetical protein
LQLPPEYDERLSSDHYGIQIFGTDSDLERLEKVMKKIGAVEVRKHPGARRSGMKIH